MFIFQFLSGGQTLGGLSLTCWRGLACRGPGGRPPGWRDPRTGWRDLRVLEPVREDPLGRLQRVAVPGDVHWGPAQTGELCFLATKCTISVRFISGLSVHMTCPGLGRPPMAF